MLQFICPSCQATCEAAAEFAGKSVVCPTCGKSVQVPHDAAAITAAPTPILLPPLTAVTTPDVAEAQQAKKRADEQIEEDRYQSIARGVAKGWLSGSIYVLLGVAIVGILFACLVPPVRNVRDAAARTQSINNLKQIALACHSFHDSQKRLPFNGSDVALAEFPKEKYSKESVANSFTSGSWAFQIAPFIDAGPLFSDPVPNRNVGIIAYMCLGRGRPPSETNGGPWTDYFYNNYLNDPMQAANPSAPDARRQRKDITDGTSNTVLVGHGNINTEQYLSTANVALSTNIYLGGTTGTMLAGDNGKISPTGVTLKRDSAVNPGIGSWGGPFPQGALVAMCDGTVHMIPYTTQNFGAFLTPTGNEQVNPDF